VAATAEDKAAARALATQGAKALEDKRFSEAIDLVSRAEAILHAPTHLLMIARAQVGIGKLVAAQETFLKLTREELSATAPAAFKNAQTTGKEELAAIEPKIGALRIIVDGAVQKKATVKLDDVVVPPALLGVFRPIDPGHHVIAVFPMGGSPVRSTVDLADAEKREVKLSIPDVPPSSGVPVNAADNPDAGKGTGKGQQPPPKTSGGFFTPLRGVGLGLGVVGIAGVAVGSVFLAKGFSAASASSSLSKMICLPPSYTMCPNGTPAQVSQLKSDDSTASSSKTLGAVLVPIGGAALVAGVALIVIGKPKPPAATSSVQITPWFSGTGGGFRGSF
jgi:hypothetical protein